MFVTYLVATLLLAVVTALLLARSEVWWVCALDGARLQLAAAGFLLLLVELVMLDRSAVGIANDVPEPGKGQRSALPMVHFRWRRPENYR